jgi:hypothetical protein
MPLIIAVPGSRGLETTSFVGNSLIPWNYASISMNINFHSSQGKHYIVERLTQELMSHIREEK